MREYGDRFLVFDNNERAGSEDPAIKALEGLSFGDVVMPYGFTLEDVDGKTIIVPLEKSQWLESIQTLIDAGGDVHPTTNCRLYTTDSCTGDCVGAVGAPFCLRAVDRYTGRYFCGCFRS